MSIKRVLARSIAPRRAIRNLPDATTALHPPRLPLVLLLPTILTSALQSIDASAAEWTYRPTARYSVEYNDNRLLRFGSAEPLIGHIAQIGTNVRYRTEVTEVNVQPNFRFERWWGDKTIDTDDQSLSVDGSHRTERFQYDLNAKISRDATLREDSVAPGDVRISERRRRETFELAPSITYRINERGSAVLSLSTRKTLFPKSGRTNLVDFSSSTVTGTIQHQLNERNTLSTTLFRSRFVASDVDADTRTIGLGLGYGYQHSPLLSGVATVSLRTSEIRSRAVSATTRQNGLTMSASGTRIFPKGTLTATASRQLTPTSTGSVTQRSEYGVEYLHRFRERLVGFAHVNFLSDQSLSALESTSEFTRLRLETRLEVHLSREWSMIGTYRHIRITREEISTPAESNTIQFAVRYARQRQEF